MECVDGEIGVEYKPMELMPFDKARGSYGVIFRLIFYSCKREHGRLVAGKLEDTAKQYWNIIKFNSGTLFYLRDNPVAVVSIGAAEVVMEFYFHNYL
jgi:hypothetical protein